MRSLYPHNRVSSEARAFLEATDPALHFSADPLVMCEALYYLTSAEDPRASTVREMIEACSFPDMDYAPLADLVSFVALADVLGAPAGAMGSDLLCPVLSARLDQLCARVLASADTLRPAELPILRNVIGITDAEDEYGIVHSMIEDLIFHPNYP